MIFLIPNAVSKEKILQASRNKKETGLHKGSGNRMTTDFWRALEDRRHLKDAFKILKGYYFQPKTNIQTYTQTKIINHVWRENEDVINMQGQGLNLSLSLYIFNLSYTFSQEPLEDALYQKGVNYQRRWHETQKTGDLTQREAMETPRRMVKENDKVVIAFQE